MVKRTVERVEFLVDVLITAIEGGIGYWAGILAYDPDKGTATIREDETNKTYDLTIETIAKGIGRVKAKGFVVADSILSWIKEDDRENGGAGTIDAIAADVIVQAALFGEIVYG